MYEKMSNFLRSESLQEIRIIGIFLLILSCTDTIAIIKGKSSKTNNFGHSYSSYECPKLLSSLSELNKFTRV